MQKKVVITDGKHMCDFNFIGNMIHILNQTFSQECDQKLNWQCDLEVWITPKISF